MNWIYVGVGGACGAMMRYGVQTFTATLVPDFPAGTALVNLLGCFVMGLLLPLLPTLPEATRPFVLVGVLGGLTTMSSFSGELVTLVNQGRVGAAMLHWAGGAVACVALCGLGYFAGAKLAGVQLSV